MTEIVVSSDNNLRLASKILEAGGLVAFPTETVYGLGASAFDGEAVTSIFEAKGRPSFNPLIIHVKDSDAAFKLGVQTEIATVLSSNFWPGPITLVLNRHRKCQVPMVTTAGLDKIALRVPSHCVAQKLLKFSGFPIAAPSANPSGCISPSTAHHVFTGLTGKIDLIIDDGPCENGLESTIIDCSGSAPILLRPGSISRTSIELALKSAGLDCPLLYTDNVSHKDKPIAPGQLQSHYAPSAKVRLYATTPRKDEELIGFGSIKGAGELQLSLSKSGNLREAAANLFAMLHKVDAIISGTGRSIAIAPIPTDGVGEAINDRLRRAAAPRKT